MERRSFNQFVPAEIIESILYNLPVKSLLRLKCVSKSWRSLMSSKGFIKEQLKRSSTNTDFTHHKLMSTFCRPPENSTIRFGSLFKCPNTLRSCSLRSLLGDDVIPALDNHLMKISAHDIRILGSCNGLILIRIDAAHLFLWNPCTRKDWRIVAPQVVGSVGGLGYDESTDDYKAVFIDVSDGEPFQTHLYSCKADSLQKIDNFDEGFQFCDHYGNFVNGKLHWLAKQEGHDYQIVALDLVDEKYEIVALPEQFPSRISGKPVLKVLGDYLSLISHNSSTFGYVDVWVMIKYGEKESWTTTTLEFACPMRHIEPLYLKKNGDIAMASTLNVFVYNKGKNELRKSRIDHMLYGKFESIVYVESLVSPFGDDRQSYILSSIDDLEIWKHAFFGVY